MPINDTTTVSPLFVAEPPDWSKQITVVASYKSTVSEAEVGNEQRARWRQRPRYAIAYTRAALSIAEFSARRSRMIQELAAPLVVPIWTDFLTLASMPDVNTASLGVSLAAKKFKVGSYAYLTQGATTYFRKITAVNSTSLSFLADGAAPAFTAGALVYPCIVGMRSKNTSAFSLMRLDQSDEAIAIEEL